MLTKAECVHEIPKGAHIEIKEGRFTGDVTLDGTLIAHFDRCSQAPILTRPIEHPRASGPAGASPDWFVAPPPPGPPPPLPGLNPPPPPTGNGWVEAVQKDLSLPSGDNIDWMYGTWTVPENPTKSGAIVYLWNGVEPTPYGNLVIQPVLQWGYNGAFGGEYWMIASWIWQSDGTMLYSTPEVVSSGDLIHGITGVTSEETINLPWLPMTLLNWKIQAWDSTIGAGSNISFTSTGMQWTWAFAGVLEAYNLTDCGQFPASGKTVFNYSSVYHGYPGYFLDRTPWVPKYYAYGGPGCGFDATVSGETGTLDY